MKFFGLEITYNSRVLEPRPWTEAQSAWAADLLRRAPAGPVLELCAGVGHIGLAAAAGSPRELVMVDVDPIAEQLALANAAANGMADRATFRRARLELALGASERFPVVIADPPWVRTDQIALYPQDPPLAIDGGQDGLDLARLCVDVLEGHLTDGGSGLLQLGTTGQARSIAGYADQLGPGSVSAVEMRTFERGVVLRLSR